MIDLHSTYSSAHPAHPEAGPLDQLRKAAREEGMKMLFDTALVKVRLGLTSLEAALSVTMAEEESPARRSSRRG
jgi:hypothetical protein